MTKHFTRNTVSADAWCAKCQKRTQHQVCGVKLGPCLQCVARLDELYEEHKKYERELKQAGFEW